MSAAHGDQVALEPATSADLMPHLTDVRCRTCRWEHPAQDIAGVGEVLSVDELLEIEISCGCDDPLPDWLIRSERPLFADPDINDEYLVPRSDPQAWEYEVRYDLVDELGLES